MVKLIGFCPLLLFDAETRYDTTHKECLAVVMGCITLTFLLGWDALHNKDGPPNPLMDLGPQVLDGKTRLREHSVDRV